MENKNNNKGVIILLIVIIAILSVLCILFATDMISFKDNNVNNNELNQNVNENKDDSNENQDSNDITIDSIKELVGFVYEYYSVPVVYCGKTEVVKIDNVNKYMSTEFNTHDDVINSLKKYMSLDVISGKRAWAATNKEYYLEKDGKLYCEETYKGYLYTIGNIDIEIIEQSKNKIKCGATIELIDLDNKKTYDNVGIILEYDNGWLVTSYTESNQ